MFACALALGACDVGGGDEADERAQRNAAAAAEYRERANGLCRRATQEQPADPSADAVQAAVGALTRRGDELRREQREFERLRPPRELRRAHRRAVRIGRDTEEAYRRILGEARTAVDVRAALAAALPQLSRLIDRANASAVELGLADCVTQPLQVQDPVTDPR